MMITVFDVHIYIHVYRYIYIYIGEIDSCVRTQNFSDDDSGRCPISIRGIESCVGTQNFSDDDDSGRCTYIHQRKLRAVSGPKTLLMTTTVSDVHATIRGK